MTTVPNKGPSVIIVVSIVTTLETIFCAARVYTRGWILRKLRLDDHLIVISVIFGWVALACGVLAVNHGEGRHVDDLTSDQKAKTTLWTLVGFAPGIMSFGVPKIAVVVLLNRLLNPGRVHRIFLWGLVGTMMAVLLGCVASLYAQCTPARAQWDYSITEKKCWPSHVMVDIAIAAGSISAFTDFYLAVYPAVVLFQLQLGTKKKFALSAALGIGSISAIVAVYKTTRVTSLGSSDFTWDTSDLLMWTCIEGATIIIASCIPVLQPLMDRVVGASFFGSSNNTSKLKSDKYKSRSQSHSRMRRTNNEVELSAICRKPKDPNGLTFLDHEGSEENILNKEGDSVKLEGSNEDDQKEGITRTDEVVVTYSQESNSMKGPKAHTRVW